MSKRYPGGYLTASPVVPTATSAPGVWTLEQQYQANGAGNWPAAANYQINKSLRFRSSASAYLNRTPGSTGNRRTWTWSAWLKKSVNGVNIFPYTANDGSGGSNYDALDFTTGDVFRIYFQGGIGAYLVTSQVFRDPSAWYHLVVAVDTTQATAANRIKLYVNGSQVTAFSTSTYPSQNYDTYFNLSGRATAIGAASASPVGGFFNGYMAEVNFIDGTAWTPSAFGTTDAYGIWQPIAYSGSYGTNGFYLPFTNTTSTTTLGYDSSGNGNNWTTNNLSLTSGTTYDSMYDSPTNNSSTVANYCVMNPLHNSGTLSNGNLTWTGSNQSNTSTFGMTSGKWYWEFKVDSFSSGTGYMGVCDSTWFLNDGTWAWSQVYSYVTDGRAGGNTGSYAYGATYTAGDIIGVALDMDNGTITFYKNGTSQGVAFNSGIIGKTLFPWFYYSASSGVTANYGAGSGFTYTPPTGFLPLNTYNLPSSNIMVGNKLMDATTYTGNGSAGTDLQTIVNAAGFKPDLVWVKARNQAYSHHLSDSVRGIDTALFSNLTGAESTYTYDIHAFNSNGFSIGNAASQNESGSTYVGWQWQAGQGTTSSNTNGTITSTVSVNPTAGFSVVTFTGGSGNNTVGHGLGVAPNMVILKRRNSTSAWLVYHLSLSNPATSFLELNTTSAVQTASPFWGASGMTSTTIGTSDNATINGATYVAYCWAAVAGYSAFGSYTGNGSTDGPFLYFGFRPKFVMVKRTDTAGLQWETFDSSRFIYNGMNNPTLYPNSSTAEASDAENYGDFLSNGFKLRYTNGNFNANGGTYIYAAFAENPFKIARAR